MKKKKKKKIHLKVVTTVSNISYKEKDSKEDPLENCNNSK